MQRAQRTGPGGGWLDAAAPGVGTAVASLLRSTMGSVIVAASTASGETAMLSGSPLVPSSSDVHGTLFTLALMKRGEQLPVS